MPDFSVENFLGQTNQNSSSTTLKIEKTDKNSKTATNNSITKLSSNANNPDRVNSIIRGDRKDKSYI